MAIRFDASADSLSRTTISGAATIMGWVKISVDRNAYTGIFAFDDNCILSAGSDGVTLMTWDGTQETNGSALTVGTWYHLAFVKAGDALAAQLTVYLNGVSDISDTRSNVQSGTTMYIGNDAFSEFLNGCVAHVKVWSAALTQAEVQQEMHTIRPQRVANLHSWLPMIATGSTRADEWGQTGNTWTANGTLADEDGPPVSWGAAARFAPFVAAGGGPTTYYSTPAGSLTSAGSLARQTGKPLAGSLTSAGAAVKRTAKTLAGSLTMAGVLAAVRTVLASVGGSLTMAGTLARQTGKTLAGSLTSAGAAARSTAKTLAGSLTSAGAAARSTAKSLAGALGLAGALASEATSGALTQAVGGALALAGEVRRQTSITVAGVLATAGAVARSTAKSLAGALGLAGALVRQLFGPSASKLDVTLSDAAVTTLTIADAAQTTLVIGDAAQTTLIIGDATV